MDEDSLEVENGFQKANKYLKFLPIEEDDLHQDADRFLNNVKTQLSSAVLLLDIKQGARYWVRELASYMDLYGLRFTKPEHIDLVKLLFELVITPELEIAVMDGFAYTFNKLIKRKVLLSPDDLCLPWRPAYKLWKSVLDSKADSYGRKFIPSYAENVVKRFIKTIRVYFPPEATQEMLDEWQPYQCPFDTSMTDSFELLELFLPTSGPIERHDKMYRLWFDEFMGLYQNLDGSKVGWEAKFVTIFSRLAGHNIGLIDWEPYLADIFSHVLKAFGLPVGPPVYQLSHSDPSYDFPTSCLWLVAMISPTNRGMSFLGQLIRAIEPFMHPSNHGWFQRSLHGAISKLCSIFSARVRLERYKKPSWDNYVPDDQKLTDEQITQFVNIVKPVVFTGLFSKHGPHDMTSALFNLSWLRPELVLPQHLEHLYPALENLTEPHRLKSTLTGILGMARSLMAHPKFYPEGRLHVIPILQLCLPGIDSNDSHKTLVTLQLITTMATLIPLVDCSEAHQIRTDLSEHERELCSQTAQLQDFIFIFIDRIFSLIEGLSLDHHESGAARAKASHTEAMIEHIVRSAAVGVFQQTSTSLFKPAFDKVWNYVSGKVFEVLVAGRLAGSLMYGVARAKPEIVLPVVVPHCCRNILDLTENKEVASDTRVDNALLWNLLLLSETMRPDGAALLEHTSSIEAVLDRTLHMTNFTAHSFSCNILERYFKAVGSIYPTHMNSSEYSLDTPLSEHLPIRDWGEAQPLSELHINWFIPSEECLAAVQSMWSKYLMRELEYLDQNEQCEREDLQRRLRVIVECIKGAGLYMPPLESEKYTFENEEVVERVSCTVKKRLLNFTMTLEGGNARNRILKTIRPLTARLLDQDKDSAKPLHIIVTIYKLLIICFGHTDYDNIILRAIGVKSIMASLENPLKVRKSDVRMVHTEMAYMQLSKLIYHQIQGDLFTKLHADIYSDLVKLGLSRYDNVQIATRLVLAKCFHTYCGSSRLIIPELCQLMITPPPQVSEEAFKGALGMVLCAEGAKMLHGSHYYCLAITRDPVILRQIWPAVIQAQHSEKPAIQLIVDNIVKRIEKFLETFYFDFPVSEGSKAAALAIRSTAHQPPELDLAAGQQAADLRTEKYRRLHFEMLTELLNLIKSDKLQWKHREFAIEMIAFLQRHDVKSSLDEVKLFTDNLTHDTVSVRKLCVGTLTGMLYSQKRSHPRQYVPRSEFSGCESVQYDLNNVPDTEEKWSKANFVEKTFWGCVHWPKQVPVTTSHPPPTPDELSEVDRYTLDKFSDELFTDTLFKYMALETKGNDRFCSRNYGFFKCLARNYGPAIVECCKVSIVKLLDDTDHQTERGRQRLIAEFVSGIVRGSKYWSFKQMNELFDWMLPIVKRAIKNVSDETMTHWGTAFATCSEDREPRKLYRLFQFLLEEVRTVGDDTDSATSLETTSRLYFLQGALGQQQWRVPQLNAYTTQLITERLASPFKSIRSRLGSVLCSCYVFDVPYLKSDSWRNPTRAEFINSCFPLIKDLEDSSDSDLGVSNGAKAIPMDTEGSVADTRVTSPSNVNGGSNSSIQPMEVDKCNSTNGAQSENGENKLILKTVLSWLQSNFDRHTTYQRWTPEILKFLPLICPHTANFSDPELKSLSQSAAKYMSKTLLPRQLLPEFIHSIKEAIGLSSWHARVTALEVLQSMMFLNQFALSGYCEELQAIIVHLLSDEQIEVQQAAATTLSGGIQFQFFRVEDLKLLNHFKKLVNVRLRSKNKNADGLLVQRCHTGILGLGAAVRAYPYDVPNFVPELLMILSDHIHDPQPIQKCVKDVLSEFKRTHHDNWLDHKQKFTDDQLVVLTDMLVSPNYYA